jgi:hypothetical protein
MLAFHDTKANKAAAEAKASASEEKMDESDDEDDDDIWGPAGLDLNIDDEIDNMYGGNDL